MKKRNNISNVMYNIKKKPLNGKKTIIAIVLACALLIYSIYILIKLLVNPTNTFIVENGKIYKEENNIGYIIRNEQVIYNKENNTKIVHLKAEGKKVANGEAIYRYSVDNEQELTEQIKQLDIEIQEIMENDNNIFSTDIKLIENEIEKKLEGSGRSCYRPRYARAAKAERASSGSAPSSQCTRASRRNHDRWRRT